MVFGSLKEEICEDIKRILKYKRSLKFIALYFVNKALYVHNKSDAATLTIGTMQSL